MLTGIILCLFLNSLQATAPIENFKKGNEAFSQGKYSDAVNYYESILDSGEYSAEVYYNLGNAYFETNNLGKSILNYERAIKAGGGSQINKNLQLAQSKIKDEIIPLPPFFVTEFFAGIRDLFSLTGWSIWTLFFLWLGLGIWSLKLAEKSLPFNSKGINAIKTGSLILAVIGLSLAFAKNYHEKNFKEVIVLAESAKLKEGASKNSPDILRLHEGTKGEVLDKIEDWYKIRLADGEQGWLLNSDLEII